MSLNLENIREMSMASPLTREIERLETQRSSWQHAISQTDSIAEQYRKVIGEGSAFAQIAKEIKALQSPAMAIAQRYKDILGEGSGVAQAIKQWQESQRTQQDHVRRMLEPLEEVRKSLVLDSSTQKIIKEFGAAHSMHNHVKEILKQTASARPGTKMLAQQMDISRTHTRTLLKDMDVGNSMSSWLKDFEKANKRWAVPNDVLSMVGSLQGLHEQFGKVALPTIDWGSAAALARILGQDGIQEQLALLGIEADGSLNEPTEPPEKGILSRKQADALVLLSLLLTVLFFAYQNYYGSLQQADTEAYRTESSATLQQQAQQIQSLTTLLEKALIQAAKQPEERFVVRERTATVRSKPKHGASMDGKLLPNEVVRAIAHEGKWIEIEYYHWLHEEYRTGWVLKKYMKRVAANHSK